GADSAALRSSVQGIVDRMFQLNRQRTGPNQCHDITVYPAIGLAGGACGGYGLLLDISDPANPRRIAAVADSNFSYWHSATFNNDGTSILFSDEWGGGGAPKCRATDPKQWGADAIFRVAGNDLRFQSYYKLPADQLERSRGRPAARVAAVRQSLASAESTMGSERRDALARLVASVEADARVSSDVVKTRLLLAVLRDLAR